MNDLSDTFVSSSIPLRVARSCTSKSRTSIAKKDPVLRELYTSLHELARHGIFFDSFSNLKSNLALRFLTESNPCFAMSTPFEIHFGSSSSHVDGGEGFAARCKDVFDVLSSHAPKRTREEPQGRAQTQTETGNTPHHTTIALPATKFIEAPASPFNPPWPRMSQLSTSLLCFSRRGRPAGRREGKL